MVHVNTRPTDAQGGAAPPRRKQENTLGTKRAAVRFSWQGSQQLRRKQCG